MQTPKALETGRSSEEFERRVEPHRRELLAHAYRMLGSLHDAEDVLQESLLAAWRGLSEFDGRASLRTWLYRIVTHRSLNALRGVRRRPAQAWNVPGVVPPEPTSLSEVTWLEPFPDARLERTEDISLAFISALQRLPPKQLAVLLLRDVVGLPASEVAELLETSVEAANGALKRARATLEKQEVMASTPLDADGRSLVADFVRAYEACDVEGVISLLTDDVRLWMPPMPFEYVGRSLAGRFFQALFDGGRKFTLVATQANGQPAFGAYLCAPDGSRPCVGLYVLALEGRRIRELVRFEAQSSTAFGLPASL